jgi:hypothetical protein
MPVNVPLIFRLRILVHSHLPCRNGRRRGHSTELEGLLSDAQKKAREEGVKGGKKRKEILESMKLTDDQKQKVAAVGRWLVALLKEWGDEEANRAKIDDLALLIGTWKSESGDIQAQTEYEWTDNKKFIRCKYKVTNKKDKAAPGTGTQVIGIDPARGLIRAWTFDSEGGMGEANWTFDGNRRVIDSSGTLADGSETTATNFSQRKGDNAFTWRSVRRTLDNEKLPDIGPVQVTRVGK